MNRNEQNSQTKSVFWLIAEKIHNLRGKAHQTMKNKSFLILIKKHFCTSSLRIDWCITITYRPTSCL